MNPSIVAPRVFGFRSQWSFIVTAIAASLLAGNAVDAATLYWDGTNAASWNTNTNWSTDPNATTPDPVAVPGASDDVIFNITTVNGARSLTLGSVAQAAQSLTFNNTGTTTITAGGTNSTLTVGSGGITVASGAGAVTIGGGNNQNVPIALAADQNWTVNGSSSLTAQNNYTGNFNLIKAGTGSLMLVGSNTSTGTITNNAGTLTMSEVSASGLTGGGIVNNASLVLFHSGANTSSSISKVISGAGSIEKTGDASTARTALSGANTFTGVLTITSGNLTVTTIGNGGAASNIGAASAAAGNIVFNGGNLDYRGGTATSDRAFTINNGITGSITLGSAASGINLTLAGATGAATTGALSVNAGSGRTLTLSGVNTYTGGTIVTGGTLAFANNMTLSGANAITLAAIGTAGTNYATVKSTAGTLTFGGTLGINLTASLSGGESFNLFQASGGALAGDFSSVSISGSYVASLTDNAGTWTGSANGLNFSFATGTGILSVASAVPEPSTYAALAGLGAIGFACLRRRRRA